MVGGGRGGMVGGGRGGMVSGGRRGEDSDGTDNRFSLPRPNQKTRKFF